MAAIETERQCDCPLCGAPGDPLYEDVADGLFEAPGRWGFRRCPACAAVWLDPRPTRASIGQAYRRYFTHDRPAGAAALAAAAIARIARERAALVYGFGPATPGLAQLCSLAARLYPGLADDVDLLARHLDASAMGEGRRLLDVGCGDGEALAFLRGLGWRASGVEIDPAAVRAARARGLEVIEGDIVSAGLADDSFEAVTSSHVLEHVHDPLAFLVESRRVLKAGGTLIAVTPNTRSALHRRHGRSWLGLDPPRHLVLFDARNLAALAQAAGFTDIRVKPTARAAGFAHLASTLIARDGRYEWGRWPGWRLWLAAKVVQARASRAVRAGEAEGEELALIARK